MKKIIISLALLIATLGARGQITLEQSYNHSGTLITLSEGEFKYFFMDVPLKQVRLYNEDHTLYREINLTIPAGYYLYDVKFISRTLFNSDEDIELLYIYQKYELIGGMDVYSYGLRVISENGTSLLNLDNGGFAEIKEGSDGPKLMAYQYIFYESYYLVYTNVYALGGELKSATSDTFSELRLFPNPVSGELKINTLPGIGSGVVTITDISGRMILTDQVDRPQGNVSIPLGSLPGGTYLISYQGYDGHMASGKFEKK